MKIYLSESKPCTDTLKESEEGLEKADFCFVLVNILYWDGRVYIMGKYKNVALFQKILGNPDCKCQLQLYHKIQGTLSNIFGMFFLFLDK